ncbi:unnamed protein product, partial [Mesorhabditis belari]|uniref:Uncharacterized protein n=1 Tax=Mesorhabditis belari TaxID=2138241 RepID=A0AAF3EXC2_9BILA
MATGDGKLKIEFLNLFGQWKPMNLTKDYNLTGKHIETNVQGISASWKLKANQLGECMLKVEIDRMAAFQPRNFTNPTLSYKENSSNDEILYLLIIIIVEVCAFSWQ